MVDKKYYKGEEYHLSSAELKEVYSPEIYLALEGYSFKAVPNNWLAKLLWKFLDVKIEIKEPVKLSELLPRVELPKFEPRVKISELSKSKKVKYVRKH